MVSPIIPIGQVNGVVTPVIVEVASVEKLVNGTEEKEKEVPRPPVGSRAEFKRVDEVYDPETGRYIFRDTAPFSAKESDDAYREYCFTVNRRFDAVSMGVPPEPVTTIDIKSPFIKKACQQVIGSIPPVSFNVPMPKVDPQTFLLFFPLLKKYLEGLQTKAGKTEEEEKIVAHVAVLVDFLSKEYASTLEQIASHLAHKEITFELYWALLVPGTIFYTTCPITSQPRAVRLHWGTLRRPSACPPYWQLDCEYVDSSASSNKEHARFGHANMTVTVRSFRGAPKIHYLPAFPLHWHPQESTIRSKLIARGKRWAALDGVHHMEYNGLAYTYNRHEDTYVKISIHSRVMVDKLTFKRQNPNYRVPAINGITDDDNDSYDSDEDEDDKEEFKKQLHANSLTNEQLLLTTPILYGFGLGDKVWVEFNVENISTFKWNDEAFKNLVLPPQKKSLIQALVESHGQKSAKFDDFIKGKGRGLVINLFGPPGIGKTMSAEATSEHVRRPLYVVGAGDLGTNSGALDRTLTQIFDIAHTWGAVVLIDEADVFLEERSVHDINRNALVAVFLRQLEYFAGILFLTTNRVKTFDEAFQSRIHVALRYRELDESAKRQIWVAFLSKIGAASDIKDEELDSLASRKVNGRQIKNAVRTAQALATNKKEALSFTHLNQVLEVMEQFEEDFKGLDQ